MAQTTCPLSSFAVCKSPNKSKQAAEISKKEKDAQFWSSELKYLNKGSDYELAKARNVIGLSRSQSKIYSTIKDVKAKGRQLAEKSKAGYLTKQAVDEGGRSTRFGRQDFIEYLVDQKRIESTLSDTSGRRADEALTGAHREYQAKAVAGRAALGLPPKYGSPVFWQPKSGLQTFMEQLQVAQTITKPFTPGGQFNPFGEGLFDFKKG